MILNCRKSAISAVSLSLTYIMPNLRDVVVSDATYNVMNLFTCICQRYSVSLILNVLKLQLVLLKEKCLYHKGSNLVLFE